MTKKGSKQINWTKKEDQIVRKFYKTKTIGELWNLFPNRSYNAVRARIQKLGLYKKDLSEPDCLKLTKEQIGLLVGLIEGEGTITINGTCNNTRIFIANTNYDIIKEIKRIIPFGYIETSKDQMKYGFSRKVLYRFQISDIRNVLRLAKTLAPYFISKKKKLLSKLIIEYCQLRLRKLRTSYGFKNVGNKEERIIRKVREVNGYCYPSFKGIRLEIL